MSEQGKWQHYNHSLISSYLHPDWISNLLAFQKLPSTNSLLISKGERCDFKPAACVGWRQQAAPADRRKKASAKTGACCYSCYCGGAAKCYSCYCGGGATVPASHTYNHTSLPTCCCTVQCVHPNYLLILSFFHFIKSRCNLSSQVHAVKVTRSLCNNCISCCLLCGESRCANRELMCE